MPTLPIDDIHLYYEVSGEGPPLLLIHGLGSCTEDWQPQIDYFSRHFRVITFDLRGHGQSTKPPGPYSIDRFARDTSKLLQKLNAVPAHVVGISLGGMIAFQLAVDDPHQVASLVIVNSGPAVPADTFKQRLPLYLRLVIIRLMGMRRMGKVLSKKLFPGPERETLRQHFVKRLAANDKRTYLASLKAIFAGWSVADRLRDIRCPTLVVAADQDYTPVALKENYVAAMPQAELVVIPDSHHALPLEKPEAFNETVARFLAERLNKPQS